MCVETVPDPLDLSSSDVSTDSFRVSWQHPASDVVLYRLTWTPTDGGDSEEVCVCVHVFKRSKFLHKVEEVQENSSKAFPLKFLVNFLRESKFLNRSVYENES